MSKLKRISIFALLAFVLASPALTVFADDDAPVATSAEQSTESPTEDKSTPPVISLSPTSEQVSLIESNVVTKKLAVKNGGDRPLTFTLYASPYTINNENDAYAYNFGASNSYSEIANWITFDTESGGTAPMVTYTLAPDEERSIFYHVTTPETVPAGSQFAAIFAQTVPEETASTDTGTNTIKAVSRVTLLLYARNAKEATTEYEETGFSLPGFLLGGEITVASRLKSTGNTDIAVIGNFNVDTIFGQNLYSRRIAYHVLPGTERLTTLSWDKTPSFGLYHVSYEYTINGETHKHTALVLIYPVLFIILTILVLTILIIWITIVIRKRKERNSKLLV